MMSFTKSVETCIFEKFATIKGRATRAEYWWFQLFLVLYSLCLFLMFIIDALIGVFRDSHMSVFGIGIIIAWFIGLFIFIIPNFCVTIRRLHDTGRSGYYILWGIIPYIGWLIPMKLCTDESDNDNKYGLNPFNKPMIEQNPLTKEDTPNLKPNDTCENKEDESRFMPPMIDK